MQTLAPFAEATFSFSLTEIHTATGGFHPSNLIGRGGSSQVFRGCLPGGKLVAVKRFDSLPGAERDFITEARLLSRLNHKNVVKLLGTCDEGGVRCLVFQLAEKGSLREHLHSSTLPTSSLHPPTLPSSHSALSPAPAVLDWTTRLKIALGAAQGLAYLHEDSSPQIIHRDLKTSNILLDSDWTARIADLGLARVAREKVGGGGRGVGGRGGGEGEVGEEGEKGEEGEEGAEAREAKQGEENEVGDNEDGGNQRIIIGAEEGARGRGEGEKVGLESQHMRGTFGYMAPEYTLTGRVATKSDVFSFGVVLLEVLSGRPALVPLEQTQQILEAPQASSARPALVSLESTQTAGDAAAAAVEESAAVVNGADGAVKAVATAGEESAANTSVLEGACAAAAAGGNGGPRPGVLSIVVWATPLLSSKQGLRQFADPRLGGSYPLVAMARAAAIAMRCTESEPSSRPAMGDVVQALRAIAFEHSPMTRTLLAPVPYSTSSSHASPASSSSSASYHQYHHLRQQQYHQSQQSLEQASSARQSHHHRHRSYQQQQQTQSRHQQYHQHDQQHQEQQQQYQHHYPSPSPLPFPSLHTPNPSFLPSTTPSSTAATAAAGAVIGASVSGAGGVGISPSTPLSRPIHISMSAPLLPITSPHHSLLPYPLSYFPPPQTAPSPSPIPPLMLPPSHSHSASLHPSVPPLTSPQHLSTAHQPLTSQQPITALHLSTPLHQLPHHSTPQPIPSEASASSSDLANLATRSSSARSGWAWPNAAEGTTRDVSTRQGSISGSPQAQTSTTRDSSSAQTPPATPPVSTVQNATRYAQKSAPSAHAPTSFARNPALVVIGSSYGQVPRSSHTPASSFEPRQNPFGLMPQRLFAPSQQVRAGAGAVAEAPALLDGLEDGSRGGEAAARGGEGWGGGGWGGEGRETAARGTANNPSTRATRSHSHSSSRPTHSHSIHFPLSTPHSLPRFPPSPSHSPHSSHLSHSLPSPSASPYLTQPYTTAAPPAGPLAASPYVSPSASPPVSPDASPYATPSAAPSSPSAAPSSPLHLGDLSPQSRGGIPRLLRMSIRGLDYSGDMALDASSASLPYSQPPSQEFSGPFSPDHPSHSTGNREGNHTRTSSSSREGDYYSGNREGEYISSSRNPSTSSGNPGTSSSNSRRFLGSTMGPQAGEAHSSHSGDPVTTPVTELVTSDDDHQPLLRRL